MLGSCRVCGMTRIDLVGVCAHCVPAAPTLDRAALVEEINTIIDEAICLGRQSAAGDAALAAVEAAGWGPRPEPITEEERDALILACIRLYDTHGPNATFGQLSDAILAALPERHRRIVLGVNGE